MQQLRKRQRQLQDMCQNTGHEQGQQPGAGAASAVDNPSEAGTSGQWLTALAAEQERCAAAGMGEAACRFLAEARSHLRAAGVQPQRAAAWQGVIPADSPLQAVGAFVLGPLMHAQQSSLQAALIEDACSFICKEVELRGAEEATRAALQRLITGGRICSASFLRVCQPLHPCIHVVTNIVLCRAS